MLTIWKGPNCEHKKYKVFIDVRNLMIIFFIERKI